MLNNQMVPGMKHTPNKSWWNGLDQSPNEPKWSADTSYVEDH